VTRARRTDANHREVVATLRRLGWRVADTHALPGFVDLIAFHPAYGVRMVEVKAPKGEYTRAQIRLMGDGWPVATVRSIDDAIALR
jgi:Holliday junction resolvase